MEIVNKFELQMVKAFFWMRKQEHEYFIYLFLFLSVYLFVSLSVSVSLSQKISQGKHLQLEQLLSHAKR